MSLKDRAILITLGLSAFAPRKTDKRVTTEVLNKHGAGHDAGRWIKNLLPEAALRPIGELDSEKVFFETTLCDMVSRFTGVPARHFSIDFPIKEGGVAEVLLVIEKKDEK